jgi:hypothetical protein
MKRSAFLIVLACALAMVSTVQCGLGGGGKGTVEVVTPNMIVELKGQGKTITVKSGEKQTVSAGTYQTKRIRIVAYETAGGRNIPWTMEVRTGFGDLAKVKVRSGKTTRIEAGPPFQLRAKTTLQKSGSTRSVDIDVIIVGESGVNYSHEIRRGQTVMPAPKCRILDRSGKVLGAGVLDYG